jgi:hypothetical protein
MMQKLVPGASFASPLLMPFALNLNGINLNFNLDYFGILLFMLALLFGAMPVFLAELMFPLFVRNDVFYQGELIGFLVCWLLFCLNF